MARTQQQRREETVARLLDASIETIIEVGYARASAATIARRAQVSDGALFRHFPTMGDFMAATAHEVMTRQLALISKRVAEIPTEAPALERVMETLGEVTGNDTNAVLYEMLVAARTDDKLRAALQQVLQAYIAQIHELARSLPGVEALPQQSFDAVVVMLTNLLDGAAIVGRVLPTRALDIPPLIDLLSREG